MRMLQSSTIAAAALALSACAGMTPTERGAATGVGIGAAAGALLSGDVGGTAAGALVGGGIGWYLGCRQEGRCGNVENRRQHYDRHAGRYYFYEPQSGRTFWENGEPRG